MTAPARSAPVARGAILRDFPRPMLARNALVGPLLPGSGKAHQLFHAMTGDVPLDHLRSLSKGVVRSSSTISPFPEPPDDVLTVEEPCLWGGLYMNHFGHMAAEGVHRLWAARLGHELRGARIVYHLSADRTVAVEPWFAQLLAMFGIAEERLLFLNRPTRFQRLHVPMQGRVLGGAILIDRYLDLFPLVPRARKGDKQRPIYVSRSRHIHTGSYLGETFVEATLAQAGFDIVYPEAMPMEALIQRMMATQLMIFCEGSALHNLDLCGRVDARIFVIGRRAGTEDRFRNTLAAACDDWEVFAPGAGGIGLDWDKRARAPHGAHTCSFTELPALIAALARFTGYALPIPDPATARAAAARDLLAFLLSPQAGGMSTDEEFGRLMRMIRARPDVLALTDPAGGASA